MIIGNAYVKHNALAVIIGNAHVKHNALAVIIGNAHVKHNARKHELDSNTF